jgi:hypothetical protein
MVAKKLSPALSQQPQQELKFLYARRMAIDAVIRSLEQYDRFRVKTEEIHKLKTA